MGDTRKFNDTDIAETIVQVLTLKKVVGFLIENNRSLHLPSKADLKLFEDTSRAVVDARVPRTKKLKIDTRISTGTKNF